MRVSPAMRGGIRRVGGRPGKPAPVIALAYSRWQERSQRDTGTRGAYLGVVFRLAMSIGHQL